MRLGDALHDMRKKKSVQIQAHSEKGKNRQKETELELITNRKAGVSIFWIVFAENGHNSELEFSWNDWSETEKDMPSPRIVGMFGGGGKRPAD